MQRSCTRFVLQVTGASGFLASVIIDQLLEAGYKVRGYVILYRFFAAYVSIYTSTLSTVRSSKAARVQVAYRSFGDQFNIAVVDDLATSDLADAFRGADALIHVGSPMSTGGGAADMLKVCLHVEHRNEK